MVVLALLVSTVWGLSCERCKDQWVSCNQRGDGTCDPVCNTEACGFDSDSGDFATSDCADACYTQCGGCNLLGLLSSTCLPIFENDECAWQIGRCGFCAHQCEDYAGFEEDLGNGTCDEACDNETCAYDDGDCVSVTQGFCSSGCFQSMLGNGNCDEECFTLPCHYDEGDCTLCNAECWPSEVGDGECNAECYTAECGWDGTDCDCAPWCFPFLLVNDECDEVCATAKCNYDSHKCVRLMQGDCAAHCFSHMLGDGQCDEECDRAECEWDGHDCECAAGCRFRELETCKDECMVPQCGFSRLPGYASCSEFRSTVEVYNAIWNLYFLQYFLSDPFDYKSCDSWCPFEQSFTQCLNDDFCSSPGCLNNFGLCQSTAECDALAFNGLCYKCKGGLVNNVGACQETCSPGLSLYPFLGNQCFPVEDDSTPEHPDVLYVDDSGQYADFGQRLSFSSLSEALISMKKHHTRILLSGEHFLTVSQASRVLASVYYNNLAPTFEDRALNITLEPACADCRATVRLDASDPPRLYLNFRAFIYGNCPKMPPSLFRIERVDFTMHGEAPRTYNSLFNFFMWEVVFTHVTFRGVNGYNSIISFTGIRSLTMINVSFYDVKVFEHIVDKQYDGYGECKLYTESILYVNGTVSAVQASNFLKVMDTLIMNVTGVTVRFVEAKNFLSATAVAQVILSDCRFLSNQFNNLLFFDVIADFMTYRYATFWHVGDPSKADVLVTNSVFRGNELQYCLYLGFGYLPRSVRVTNSDFLDEWHPILLVDKSAPVQKSDIYGVGKYENGVRINADPIFLDMSHLTLQNCTSPLGLFRVSNFSYVSVSDFVVAGSPETEVCATALVFSGCFNVSLTRIFISGQHCNSGYTVLNFNSTTGGLLIESAHITDSSGEELFSISTADVVTFSNLTVTRSTATHLIVLTNVISSLVLSSLFEHTEAQVATFLCDSKQFLFMESRFVLNQVGKGGVVELLASKSQTTNLKIENSWFDRNRAGGAIVSVQSVLNSLPSQLILRHLDFTHNIATIGMVLTSSKTALMDGSEVQDCRFLRNTAGKAVIEMQYEKGALTLLRLLFKENEGHAIEFAHSSISVAPELHIIHTEILGSAVYIWKSLSGSVFSASDSVFANCLTAGVVLQYVSGTLSNCTLRNNTAEAGGALRLEQNSVLQVSHSTFANNLAASAGGAVVVIEGSRLTCEYCTFAGNSAGTTGGALSISPSAAANMSDCVFTENSAASSSALYIMMSAESVAVRCEFHHNRADSEATIAMFYSALTLRNCTMRDNYGGQMTPGVVMSLSNLTAEACTFAGLRGLTGTALHATMRSIVQISASELRDIESPGGAVYVEDSTIDVSHSTFQSMSADYGSVVVGMGNSHLSFSNNTVTQQWNKRGGALYILQSTCTVSDSRFSELNSSAVFSKGSTIVFDQCSFYSNFHSDISTTEGGGLFCQDCYSVRIVESVFTGLKAISGAGLFLANSKTTDQFTIEKCTFQDNFAEESGGIHAEMAPLAVKQCTFINNKAANHGGAVTLQCTGACRQSVQKSRFFMNSAGSHGGAISWQGVAPSFAGNKLEANTASYGPDVSSFSTSLILVNSSLQAVASGQVFPSPLVVEVRDHYNQTVLIDNSTSAELATLRGEIYGAVKATASMGKLVFSDFSLVGQINTTIRIFSMDLNFELSTDVSFRNCTMGEFESKGRCIVCGPGTYSVDPAQACTECDKNADCAGSYFLVPRPGYWRPSTHSTTLYECPNPAACLGPPALTGTCALGYTGNMCQTCAVNYVRYAKTSCQPCPSVASNVVLTVGLIVGAILFSVVLVVSSIKSAYKEKSQMSLSLKILMNYLQLVMLMGNFNLGWPTLAKRLLNIQDSAGGFSEQIFAPGCLRNDYDENEDFYWRVVAMAFVPLAVLSLSSAVWALWALVRRQASILRNELVGSATILFFLVHPNVTIVMFSALNCEEVDGEYWVVGLQQRCWQGAHWKFAVATAVPCILVWGVGVPALILLLLSRHKNELRELQARVRFGYLFNGYKPEKYYWEFIVIYRKLVVISLAVFLSRFAQVVPALATLAVLLLSFALQDAHKPFRQATFNTLEQRSLLVSFVTLFCGLYFLFNTLSTAVEGVFFAVIVGVNVYFLQYWVRTTFKALAVRVFNRLPCLQRRFVVLGEDRVVTIKQYKAIQQSARLTRRALSQLQKQLYFKRINKQIA